MKFDASLLTHDLTQMPALARFADEIGFDGIWTFETAHEPFLPLVLAAEHSQRLTLGTSIAVAFPRSPTILAQIAWDLAQFSQGRFILGLGTQVKGHNERRFGVKWEKPVEKMRDVILAVRAVWHGWQNRTRLDYQGEFFKLTLMTPFFSPAPHAYHRVPIFIAGVNRRMCQLAGELCEGFHVHPLHTARYIREAILPNIESGLAKSGRPRHAIELSSSIFAIPSDDPEQAATFEAEVRQQISFYAS
ncbi:MAG: TIGR03617 family F420-dependent LLM class oxidoreductase, partial [Candidatus Binatia bacterium]